MWLEWVNEGENITRGERQNKFGADVNIKFHCLLLSFFHQSQEWDLVCVDCLNLIANKQQILLPEDIVMFGYEIGKVAAVLLLDKGKADTGVGYSKGSHWDME